MQNQQTDNAPILVVEGIDGSGKGTQSKLAYDTLTRQGHRCAYFSFPRYEQTFFGKRIGDFLNGEFGTLDELNPFLVSLLYSGDRFESREAILQAQTESELVILDRYVPSNIAHQASKLSGAQRTQLIEWIEQIEYEIFAVPKPTRIILLDTPVETSQDLIARKAARTYTDHAADLQESDVSYLAKVRDVYLELASNRGNWSVVPVTDDSGLRSIESISENVLEIARSLIQM